MKFSVNTQNCIIGIQKAASITPTKSGMVMLSTIWIKASKEAGTITIMSTDAGVQYLGTFPAYVVEEGLIGLSSKTFTDLFRALPQGTVEVSTEGEQAVLRQSGRTYRLPLSDPTFFQPLSPIPESMTQGGAVSWNGKALIELVDRVQFCVGDDDDSPVGCMVIRPDSDGKVHICALDGTKFALCSLDYPDLYTSLPRSGLLIQKKYMASLGKLMPEGDIQLGFDEKRLYIVDSRDTVSLPLTPMDFPDYSFFVNKVEADGCTTVRAALEDVGSVISRMSIFITNENEGAYLAFQGDKVTLTSSAHTLGSAVETIPATIEGPLDAIAFGVRSLSEIIQHLGSKGEIEMRFTSSDGPCRFTLSGNTDYMVIAMPLNMEDESYYEEVSE